MIIDLQRFVERERPGWEELERELRRFEEDAAYRPTLEGAMRFHALYQKASADLARVEMFAGEPEVRAYLESLVARAYAEIHESRGGSRGAALRRWLLDGFPAAFRRRIGAFWLALAVLAGGAACGSLLTAADLGAKEALVPPQFLHLLQDPAERVAEEERSRGDEIEGRQATFAGVLIANNIGVSVFLLALGMTWGVGTLILLFYNGVLLGLVAADYLLAGQGVFLFGWLLPHGVIEVPAVVIAGQAGLVLGGAVLGGGSREALGARLRAVGGDVVLLIAGVAMLLVWAGLVEAFLSQFHEPVVPYAAKIAFGVLEGFALVLFLTRGLRR